MRVMNTEERAMDRGCQITSVVFVQHRRAAAVPDSGEEDREERGGVPGDDLPAHGPNKTRAVWPATAAGFFLTGPEHTRGQHVGIGGRPAPPQQHTTPAPRYTAGVSAGHGGSDRLFGRRAAMRGGGAVPPSRGGGARPRHGTGLPSHHATDRMPGRLTPPVIRKLQGRIPETPAPPTTCQWRICHFLVAMLLDKCIF
ncbi:uncharacterized protein LOC120695407 [Panicum virgatum]|uniref:uncharacterized protein LOC120695407 n=1 Tax=Panicum virgatum TaxID=38727 RepID=UPI0019D611E0|nr:uncharacterized protein LOC120695407 [Panicum virgatum]